MIGAGRTARGTLGGRAVELREVAIVVALEANKAGDNFQAALHVLVHSAHWADTGERVFASREVLLTDWPMSAMREINGLAALAGELNMPEKADAPSSVGDVATGSNGVAHPSH